MSLQFSMALMETLAEGVILLGKDGQMTDHNRAARPWLKRCLGSAPAIAEAIQKAAQSSVQSAVRVDSIFESSAHTSEFYLCKNGVKGFAIVIAKISPAPPTPYAESGACFSLLSEDLRHTLTQLRLQLEKTAPFNLQEMAQTQLQTLRLSRYLIAMEQLCDLHQGDAFLWGDRVSLQDITRECIDELSTRRDDFSFNQANTGEAGGQDMFFGHAPWLKVAVKGLLECLGESVPEPCRIEIRVWQNGGFVMLTGAPGQPSHPTSILVKPDPDRSLEARATVDIRLVICQRIADLHGGQLKIVALEPSQPDAHLRGIESFMLSLPTNKLPQSRDPAACADCIFARQAELYAEDLAFLVPRPPAGNTISNDELDFLAQVTTHPAPSPQTRDNAK
jgi:hypothetical protein